MKSIIFLVYFIKLRLLVSLNLHKTANPLDWNWRRRHWHGSTSMRGRSARNVTVLVD